MNTNREPAGSGGSVFWQEHRRLILFAAAVVIAVAAVLIMVFAVNPAGRTVDHITASYSGETKAGIVLDEKNTGFTVTAYFKDGHSEDVTGLHVYAIRDGKRSELEKGWRVVNPTVLEKDTLTTVSIAYEKFSCTVSIQCTTKGISRLTATYLGSTEEGTVISNGNENLNVTAYYTDGTSEHVSNWTLASAVTLKPKQRYLLEVHYEDSLCAVEVTCTTPTPEEFQQGCISAGYFSLYRNPAHYTGANVAVDGFIVERRPLEDGSVEVYLEMEGDFLGLTKGMLCAVYSNALHGELPTMGTHVKIYGMFKGVEFRTVKDESRDMPVMNAEYVVRQ